MQRARKQAYPLLDYNKRKVCQFAIFSNTIKLF